MALGQAAQQLLDLRLCQELPTGLSDGCGIERWSVGSLMTQQRRSPVDMADNCEDVIGRPPEYSLTKTLLFWMVKLPAAGSLRNEIILITEWNWRTA